jgi:hypothetical protein
MMAINWMGLLSLHMIRSLSAGMRWILGIGCVLVFLAGAQLFLLAEYTDSYFAWTVNPPLTAAFLGAFFWSAFVLALLSARAQVWAQARVGVVGVLLFVWLMLVATLLHIDRFHLNSSSPVAAWAARLWLLIYVLDPPILLALLVRQLRVPGGDPPRMAQLPAWFRLTIAVQGAVAVLAGLALFIEPSLAGVLWPWQLTPLTARAVSAWLLALGVILGQAIWEDDWQRVRAGVVSYLVLGVLQVLTLARYAGDVDWNRPQTWIYLAFVTTVLLVGLRASFEAWSARRPIPAAGV